MLNWALADLADSGPDLLAARLLGPFPEAGFLPPRDRKAGFLPNPTFAMRLPAPCRPDFGRETNLASTRSHWAEAATGPRASEKGQHVRNFSGGRREPARGYEGRPPVPGYCLRPRPRVCLSVPQSQQQQPESTMNLWIVAAAAALIPTTPILLNGRAIR